MARRNPAPEPTGDEPTEPTGDEPTEPTGDEPTGDEATEPTGDTLAAPEGYVWVTRKRTSVTLGVFNALNEGPVLIDEKSFAELAAQGWVLAEAPAADD